MKEEEPLPKAEGTTTRPITSAVAEIVPMESRFGRAVEVVVVED